MTQSETKNKNLTENNPYVNKRVRKVEMKMCTTQKQYTYIT